MTAAVWLAPLLPKLPLPLAQRAHRLLTAKPGAETQVHALRLCEGMVAYAACLRAGFAAAVAPVGRRGSLVKAVAELRRVVQQRDANIANYRDLLIAAAETIDYAQPGHLLGLAELTRPRTSWVARMQLVESLASSVELSEAIRAGAIDGGIEGIVDLWVCLIESRRAAESPADDAAWLASLGDLIVDLLSSSMIAGAELVYAEQTADGGRLHLHGTDRVRAEAGDDAGDDYPRGVVCWRVGERVISSCGLLNYWVDGRDVAHVGVIAKQLTVAEYLDHGSDKRSPAEQSGRVDWAALHADEPAAGARARGPVFALAAALTVLILGGAWWMATRSPAPEPEPVAVAEPATPEPANDPRAELDDPAPELDDDEIVIEGPREELAVGGSGGGSAGALTEADESKVETAPVWFESERNLGICEVTYDSRTRAANLHLKTRAPEGKLEFSYRCGQYRGTGSIDVKRSRVNGVLFCKKDGAVKVKTVRNNEGRCDR